MVFSLIIINYGTTYILSFWYHATKYINVLNFSLQLRPGKYSDLYKPLKNKKLS